ncbi:MAG: hypothetical protein AMJ84_12565 [Acidithiobacillales bacterium SM23_46]|nr:MAG: hypothetical protein AMJ84_12565 [Acidithiobacillales bacterium SM23_46]
MKDLKDAPEPLLRCVRLNNLESLDCQANLTVFKRDFPFGPLNVQGLDKRFNASMERGREEIPWATMACILALARSCAPSSELQIGESWHGKTALDDLLGVTAGKVNNDRQYRSLQLA